MSCMTAWRKKKLHQRTTVLQKLSSRCAQPHGLFARWSRHRITVRRVDCLRNSHQSHTLRDMLLAASVYITNSEKLRARWKLESGLPAVPGQKVHTPAVTGPKTTSSPLTWTKDDYTFLPANELGPSLNPDQNYMGAFVVY